jgi:hypothetical protein
METTATVARTAKMTTATINSISVNPDSFLLSLESILHLLLCLSFEHSLDMKWWQPEREFKTWVAIPV